MAKGMLLITFWLGAAIPMGPADGTEKEPADIGKRVQSIYDFAVQDIDGRDVKLDKYKGQVCLIVNTASR